MADKTTNELTLKLSIKEANTLLKGLGELRFKQAYALVSKIQQAAAVQLGSNGHSSEEPAFPSVELEQNKSR